MKIFVNVPFLRDCKSSLGTPKRIPVNYIQFCIRPTVFFLVILADLGCGVGVVNCPSIFAGDGMTSDVQRCAKTSRCTPVDVQILVSIRGVLVYLVVQVNFPWC